MKRLALLLSTALIAGAFALPAAPAQARFGGAATCDMLLPEWPTSGLKTTNVDCWGRADGVDLTNPLAPKVVIGESFLLRIESYDESCTQGLPPAIGRADGTILSPPMGHFEWVRAGTQLVFVPVIEGSKVAGIGEFVPWLPLGLCSRHAAMDVTIAGLEYGAI